MTQLSLWTVPEPTSTPEPPQKPSQIDPPATSFAEHIPSGLVTSQQAQEITQDFTNFVRIAAQRLRKRLPKAAQLAIVHENDDIHLDLYQHQDGTPPALRITRHANGDIKVSCCGHTWQGLSLHSLDAPLAVFEHQIRLSLVRETFYDLPPHLLATAHIYNFSETNDAVVRETNNLIAGLTAPYDLPENALQGSSTRRRHPEHEDPRKLLDRHYRHLLRKYILDPDRAREARRLNRISNSQLPSAHQYNLDVPAQNPQPPNFDQTSLQPALRTAVNRARPHLPRWDSVEFIENPDGSTTVRALGAPNIPHQLSVTAHPGGQIILDAPDKTDKTSYLGIRLNFNHARPHVPLIRYTAHVLLLSYLQDHPDPAQAFVQPPLHVTSHYRSIINEAEHIVALSLKPPIMPKGARTKEIALDDVAKTVTRLVRTKLANPATFHAASQQHTTNRARWSLRIYNELAINGDLLTECSRTMPSVTRFYQEALINKQKDLTNLEDPADLVRVVRQNLPLSRSAWKAFLRLEGPCNTTNPEHIQALCQAIADANRPDANPAFVQAVAQLHYQSYQILAISQENAPNAWTGWVRAVNRFLALEIPYSWDLERDLSHIADAIRHLSQMRPQDTWGTGTWEQMTQRADRVLQRRDQDRVNAMRAITWDSALRRTTIAGVSFQPITNGAQMDDMGNLMGNCLGSYAQRCQSGQDRIFTAHDAKGALLAAVQLHHAGTAWTCVQIEGPHRSHTSPEVRDASNLLAEQYNQAQDLLTQRDLRSAD